MHKALENMFSEVIDIEHSECLGLSIGRMKSQGIDAEYGLRGKPTLGRLFCTTLCNLNILFVCAVSCSGVGGDLALVDPC